MIHRLNVPMCKMCLANLPVIILSLIIYLLSFYPQSGSTLLHVSEEIQRKKKTHFRVVFKFLLKFHYLKMPLESPAVYGILLGDTIVNR